jgi:hypothetical protein
MLLAVGPLIAETLPRSVRNAVVARRRILDGMAANVVAIKSGTKNGQPNGPTEKSALCANAHCPSLSPVALNLFPS